MAEFFKKRISNLLKRSDYQGLKLPRLADAIGVTAECYAQFKTAFEQMHRAGHVLIGEGDLVTLPPTSGTMVGTFRANPRGFGFVTPLEPTAHGDLFIAPGSTGGAMTGDIVSAKVMKAPAQRRKHLAPGRQYRGKIIEILERAQNRFVGVLLKEHHRWVVIPDGSAFTEPICVGDVTAKNAAEKNKVIVELISWPSETRPAEGVIIELLGKAGRYDTELKAIIRRYHLPEEFDRDCIEQAGKAVSVFDAEKLNGRADITGKVVITIDPADAKDFDDAISLEKMPENHHNNAAWVLGVHIADVSWFVPADSPFDIEAGNRGNSVYLPAVTIPMLPEVISNGVCSLQPNRKRYVKSAYITYDNKGKVLETRFENSVVKSTMRLTYVQADRILKGRTKKFPPKVINLLKDMETLSRLIEKRRAENGMLTLDLPETELIMDKAQRVVDARPADSSYPHTVIEMFMVEANEAVAGFLDRRNADVMRRIHPQPDSLAMKELSMVVRSLGLHIPKSPERADIQILLDSVKGSDCALAVNLLVLRSLEKALYSPLHIGHFALASSNYCHFTSPIRRYADLLVHRVLQRHIKGPSQWPAQADVSDRDLTDIGKHITFTEQRAEDAEKQLKTLLILQMLSSRTGDELDCVVTGLAGFGVFVRSCKYGVEGLIRTEALGSDIWKYVPKTHCVVGQRSGRVISLGQAINCRIICVNLPALQLNFEPAEPLTGGAGGRGRRKKAYTRKASGKKRR